MNDLFLIPVAIPGPLDQIFTYQYDRELKPGVRVLVPFRNRQVIGVVVVKDQDVPVLGNIDPKDPKTKGSPPPKVKIRVVTTVLDQEPIYSQSLLNLAGWMSSYYLHPLGDVLRTMLPASMTKVTKEEVVVTPDGQAAMASPLSPEGRLLTRVFGRRPQLTKPTTIRKLAVGPQDGDDFEALTLKDLQRLGLVKVEKGSTLKTRPSKESDRALVNADHCSSGGASDEEPNKPNQGPSLTNNQCTVLEQIKNLMQQSASKPILLHGVTGSGKTEVYLRTIQEIIERQPKAQTLVLVPEISLTPQMTRIFEQRFANRVAVVHSSMSDPDRWNHLEKIRRGEAAILIGPRSAVFAPFCHLQLILVDEEHDSSYKQATGLAYSGRDVAVVRGQREQCLVILGSATPSVESYVNAQTGKYTYLTLPTRVSDRPMPAVSLYSTPLGRGRQGRLLGGPAATLPNADGPGNSRPSEGVSVSQAELASSDSIVLDPAIEERLATNLKAGHQAIVLVNRRGYANFVISLADRQPVRCPSCSISLTLHRRSTLLRCHYCDYRISLKSLQLDRPSEAFVSVGYGSEKAQDYFQSLLPTARIARLDSDTTNQPNALQNTLESFRKSELDILIGTQMLAKGHDFPGVTLIVILEVDQLLGLPDFRAGERTFQLIVQAAGRAGRGNHPGQVLIQTIRPDHPIVNFGIAQDSVGFLQAESAFRQIHGYPPYGRMIAFEVSSPDQGVIERSCRQLENWLSQQADVTPKLFREVKVLGPTLPAIEMIRGRHRRTLILCSAQTRSLRIIGQMIRVYFQTLKGDQRLRIDVDPQNLL